MYGIDDIDDLASIIIYRQEGLLSDEEAQEVTRLLSPKDKPADTTTEWLPDGISAPPSLMNDSITTVDSSSHVDLTSSHIADSVAGSESEFAGKLYIFSSCSERTVYC